jgi:hypothetical protein
LSRKPMVSDAHNKRHNFGMQKQHNIEKYTHPPNPTTTQHITFQPLLLPYSIPLLLSSSPRLPSHQKPRIHKTQQHITPHAFTSNSVSVGQLFARTDPHTLRYNQNTTHHIICVYL